MKKKLIALLLCVCLISSFMVQPAYAMGAEGAIIGGGAAAAGITLTMPQVALLVAAGFGLVYAVNHADDIANGLNNALNNAATNISNGIEELTYWKEQATKGAIALSSAPAWIIDTIKGWVSGLYETANAVPIYCNEYPANTPIPAIQFWYSNTVTYDVPTTVIRSGNIDDLGTMYGVAYTMLVISNETFSGCKSYRTHDVTYYYKDLISSSSILNNGKPLAGDNKLVYDNVSAMPSYNGANEYSGSNWAQKHINAWLDGYFGPTAGSICPEETVGGIDNVMDQYGIDNIKVPDLDIGGSGLLTPEQVENGAIDDVLGDVMTRLKQQEMTWTDYMTAVGVGTPAVSIPQVGSPAIDFPITDTGVGDIPIDTTIPSNPSTPSNPSVEVPEGLAPFTISLSDLFPFCIPFDIADFVNVLCAEPEAPKFEWAFPSPDGNTYKMEIDLSPFDGVAQLLRNMELLLFCIGLALMTRNQIRG